MKLHIWFAALLCLGQSLRDPGENKNELKTDDNDTTNDTEVSALRGGLMRMSSKMTLMNDSSLDESDREEIEEEVAINHMPRSTEMPSWFEIYSQDPKGELHMSVGFLILIAAALLQYTLRPKPRQEKEPNFLEQGRIEADVDADASDDEELKPGLGMRFWDDKIEEDWEQDSYPKNKQRGAVLLALVAAGMAVDRCYALHELSTCRGDWFVEKVVEVISMVILAKVFGFLAFLQAFDGSWDVPYWAILGFFAIFFIVANLWPLGNSCDALVIMSKVCTDPAILVAASKKDCTLQGHTACQMLQLWVLIMPYSLPQFRRWHFTFAWLAMVYIGISWLYAEVFQEKSHINDLPVHFALLVVTAVLGTMKKYFLEKGMRRHFIEDNAQRKALERLYTIFDGMVPKYVIPRMLTQEPIADYRERVTILFVLIHDFHVEDANAALQFLNEYFGKMDDICAANKVTKIETVSEEYVACVGVLPEDLPPDENSTIEHHQRLLERLFAAAHEIRQLQSEKIKFKMGVHTGEIHAGVIGQKLPRFRLFGDTINTSARMMQKAAPGQLMFGEATNNLLPNSLASVTMPYKNKDGGDTVVMKGKGDVRVFLFEPASSWSPPKQVEETSSLSSGKVKETEVKEEVDKVLRHVAGSLREVRGWLLSEKADFTSEDELQQNRHMFSEAKFQEWFHNTNFVRRFRPRLHRQLLLMAVMTLFDLIHMEHTKAWEIKDKATGMLPNIGDCRFTVLLTCRGGVLALGLAWSYFARTPAFLEKRMQAQWGLVATNSVVACLMFLSYDALIFPQITKRYSDMGALEFFNQQLSLVFVLAYFIVTNTHPALFHQSLVYIPVGTIFMLLRDRTSLYISNIGRVVFLCTVLVSCMLAHLLEQTSRARFKAKTPVQVVGFVRDLFGRFDDLTNDPRHRVYKVETVGDAYIAGMAERPLTATKSSVEVVLFGMAMIEATARWAEALGVKVTCRVGVHYGECVGGVVGKGMQRYHLFGKFMGEVDTLEATSREGITQISKACKESIVEELLGRKASSEAEALEALQKEFPGAVERTDEKLTTSKGEEHDYEEVGGRTILIYKEKGDIPSK
ncbi:unnamed protein product [Effrenium voratum]|nr:unnamed protein product [Effrenium voratum]